MYLFGRWKLRQVPLSSRQGWQLPINSEQSTLHGSKVGKITMKTLGKYGKNIG
jgi:hypothetical protein